MRCKKCDYRLWNLTERRCPECGTPFRPSEFEFVPNSVQFCCPHCGQPYYGTGPTGHLVPPAFSCVKCGAAIQMDDMVLLPTGGVQEEQTQGAHMPWLERRKRGFIKAWLATIAATLLTPGRLMQALPEEASMGAARGFAALTILLTAAVFVGPFTLLPVVMSPLTGSTVQHVLLIVAISIALTFALLETCTLLWGLCAHGLLRITGPTAGSFRRTMQSMYYSTGANAVSAIPCLGWYVGWIWWTISATLMLKAAQRVHGGRAALAVVAPPVTLLVCIIGLYIWWFVSVIPSIRASAAAAPNANAFISSTDADTMLQAVLDYARDHNGRGPRHMSELLASDRLTAADFLGVMSKGQLATVPLGSTTLDRVALMNEKQIRACAAAAAAALPKGTAAHRLGDFVFVYHGLDLSTADGALWVMLGWPNLLATTLPAAPIPLWIGTADGTLTAMYTRDLPAAIAEQNSLRAKKGLPPLPDLFLVTHAQPGVAPDWNGE